MLISRENLVNAASHCDISIDEIRGMSGFFSIPESIRHDFFSGLFDSGILDGEGRDQTAPLVSEVIITGHESEWENKLGFNPFSDIDNKRLKDLLIASIAPCLDKAIKEIY